MKKFILFLFAITLLTTSCAEDHENLSNPQFSGINAMSNFGEPDSEHFGLLQSCPQTNQYQVRLRTLGGQFILPANVQPSTQYDVVITYTGAWVCCANPAYCFITKIGFTSADCLNSASGDVSFRITTNATLPPFGIIGVVGPTDCSGSLSSAQSCAMCWREIQ